MSNIFEGPSATSVTGDSTSLLHAASSSARDMAVISLFIVYSELMILLQAGSVVAAETAVK
jgi:hypothetical protein